jgi:hypothetical protein
MSALEKGTRCKIAQAFGKATAEEPEEDAEAVNKGPGEPEDTTPGPEEPAGTKPGLQESSGTKS